MMLKFEYTTGITVCLILSFFLTACSDNGNDPDVDTPGDATVTISGEIEGEHEGWGLFNQSELPQGEDWGIQLTNNSSFHVQISLWSIDGSVTRPSPGSYTISSETSDFTGIYTDLESGGIGAGADYEYSTIHEETGGTLIIESSTDEEVSGSFEFVAAHDTDEHGNVYGFVTVSGEFTATNQNLLE